MRGPGNGGEGLGRALCEARGVDESPPTGMPTLGSLLNELLAKGFNRGARKWVCLRRGGEGRISGCAKRRKISTGGIATEKGPVLYKSSGSPNSQGRRGLALTVQCRSGRGRRGGVIYLDLKSDQPDKKGGKTPSVSRGGQKAEGK